jgi:molybdopterin molybdotransferase
MLDLDQAQAEINKQVRPATTTETISIDQALGRFLAETVSARVDNPAFSNSAMDGYALRFQDLAANNFHLPLNGESRCGLVPPAITAGHCMRIFTGAPVPDGADTVVIQENISSEKTARDEMIVFPDDVQPGSNIRKQGEDFNKNDPLYEPGHRLQAHDLALLSTAGIARVKVYVRPKILVIATGDELVAPGEKLQPGQIYESNRLTTILMLREMGAEVTNGGTAADDVDSVRGILAGAGDFDFVITSGGVSVGDHDLVKQVFEEFGQINFWRVRIKPGKPVAFGHLGKRGHFFALPGNPVSSLVTFKLFVLPALVAWFHGKASRIEIPVTVTNSFSRKAGRLEFLRARLNQNNDKPECEVLTGQGSHMMGTLRKCNGFIKVNADSTGFNAGDQVKFVPMDGFV